MQLRLRQSRRLLAGLWFVVGIFLILIVFLQCLLGKYETRYGDAIGWLLPTVMPTLSLIAAVMTAGLFQKRKDKYVDSFIFWLAMGMSIFYLGLVAATIGVGAISEAGPLAIMRMSNLWLGPVQGLTAGCLGVFFVYPDKSSTID